MINIILVALSSLLSFLCLDAAFLMTENRLVGDASFTDSLAFFLVSEK